MGVADMGVSGGGASFLLTPLDLFLELLVFSGEELLRDLDLDDLCFSGDLDPRDLDDESLRE